MEDILDKPCTFNDCAANSFREYFKALLMTLWIEGEGFSGKRPFGNSGWEYDLYENLIEMGEVDGKLDEDGFVESLDKQAADKIIANMIGRM